MSVGPESVGCEPVGFERRGHHRTHRRDRDVLAIKAGHVAAWAPGAAAVGIAADTALGLLVIVVNAHE